MEEDSVASLAQRSRAALYLLVYILLSGGQIFFNKWVLSPSQFNFPYPITLTAFHMLFSSLLCVLLFKVFKVRKLAHTLTWGQYMRLLFPIGAMFAMTLWFGNTAFLFISISFAQMLKACLPVVVLLLSAAVGLEELTWRMFGIMCVISGGVLVASVGEVSFVWVGVVYQMLGVVGESARLILAELLLKKRGLSMDPLSMMYYVSPASAACLLLPWLSLELPRLLARFDTAAADDASPSATSLWALFSAALSAHASSESLTVDVAVLVLSALCTFALNLSVFVVILHTSALTIRVAGVVKDWLVVLVSALVFADTRLTPLNMLGYAVAITGVVLYNNTKLSAPSVAPPPHQAAAEAEKALHQAAAEAGRAAQLAEQQIPLVPSAKATPTKLPSPHERTKNRTAGAKG